MVINIAAKVRGALDSDSNH